jgi:hypothetical protein
LVRFSFKFISTFFDYTYSYLDNADFSLINLYKTITSDNFRKTFDIIYLYVRLFSLFESVLMLKLVPVGVDDEGWEEQLVTSQITNNLRDNEKKFYKYINRQIFFV